MAKPKATERNVPTQEKSETKMMNEEAATSKGKATRPPTPGGMKDKGKGKGFREVYASSGWTPISKILRNHKVHSWAREFYADVDAYWANLQEVIPNEPNMVDASEIDPILDAQTSNMTPSTYSQIQNDTSGTDAQADGATESPGSPLFLPLCLSSFYLSDSMLFAFEDKLFLFVVG